MNCDTDSYFSVEEVEGGGDPPLESTPEHDVRVFLCPIHGRITRSIERQVEPRHSHLVSRFPILLWNFDVNCPGRWSAKVSSTHVIGHDHEILFLLGGVLVGRTDGQDCAQTLERRRGRK